jgi:hypothetical protein
VGQLYSQDRKEHNSIIIPGEQLFNPIFHCVGAALAQDRKEPNSIIIPGEQLFNPIIHCVGQL